MERRPEQDFFSDNYALKDTIRFVVNESHRQVKELNFLYRHVFGPILKIKDEDYFCVQSFVSRGIYDVTLNGNRMCESAFSYYEKNRGEKVFEGVKVLPLFQYEFKLLTVQMYNPFISDQEVNSFLFNYCSKVTLKRHGLTSFGAWNGKRVYSVVFKKDPSVEGGVLRPPPIIFINRSRGYLFFTGMPQYCRKCRKYGHADNDCNRCLDCLDVHQVEDCPKGKDADKRSRPRETETPETSTEQKRGDVGKEEKKKDVKQREQQKKEEKKKEERKREEKKKEEKKKEEQEKEGKRKKELLIKEKEKERSHVEESSPSVLEEPQMETGVLSSAGDNLKEKEPSLVSETPLPIFVPSGFPWVEEVMEFETKCLKRSSREDRIEMEEDQSGVIKKKAVEGPPSPVDSSGSEVLKIDESFSDEGGGFSPGPDVKR